jgi:hypothetical protein
MLVVQILCCLFGVYGKQWQNFWIELTQDAHQMGWFMLKLTIWWKLSFGLGFVFMVKLLFLEFGFLLLWRLQCHMFHSIKTQVTTTPLFFTVPIFCNFFCVRRSGNPLKLNSHTIVRFRIRTRVMTSDLPISTFISWAKTSRLILLISNSAHIYSE